MRERAADRPKGGLGSFSMVEWWRGGFLFPVRQSEPLSHQEIGPPVCTLQTSSILIEGSKLACKGCIHLQCIQCRVNNGCTADKHNI